MGHTYYSAVFMKMNYVYADGVIRDGFYILISALMAFTSLSTDIYCLLPEMGVTSIMVMLEKNLHLTGS